jgi:hypothetical protein
VGPRVGLDAVVKKKIPFPQQKSDPDLQLTRFLYLFKYVQSIFKYLRNIVSDKNVFNRLIFLGSIIENFTRIL